MLSIVLFLLTLNWAEELIVPPAGVPNQGLLKSTMQNIDYQEELPQRCYSCELLEATEDFCLL
jgi:hypothetical protein